MKKVLILSAMLSSVALFSTACANEDGATSSRTLVEAKAKDKQCSIQLVTSACSEDGNIASVKCDGVEIAAKLDCPQGTKCKVFKEAFGDVAYCVEAAQQPDCIISTCDASDAKKILKCKDGKLSKEDCGDKKVCRVEGKNSAGKDLAAACMDPILPTEKSESAEDYDPCTVHKHGTTSKTACSADKKVSLYTCSDGHVMTEPCGLYSCELVNLRAYVKDNVPMFGEVLANLMPSGDIAGCNLKSSLDAVLQFWKGLPIN